MVLIVLFGVFNYLYIYLFILLLLPFLYVACIVLSKRAEDDIYVTGQ